MSIRVLIVDNHPLFRQGVEALVRQAEGIEVAGHAISPKEAVDKARRLKPDVVLLDTQLPGSFGMELIREITQLCPGVGVLVLTNDNSPESAMGAIEAGAVGYVLKDIEPGHLANAIRYSSEGKSMVNPQLTRVLLERVAAARRITARDDVRARGITDREIEVLSKLVMGLSARQIAETLYVSEATVKTHLRSIYRKLNVRNRAQAAAYAAARGLHT